ncbi:anthocyanidin reductase ((2S)-flavan-3-ol-forming)-like [Vitis riparia]|uniref:anthocyanidin reductase ((2S)-flavan-3-ol-forming)-like n=1 Tax=Vitis riparia TaxID=96939 RepID=UPI00155A996A|nr:anthocyanidin reductase ((2S)-flavan-3-ol-forming)-like [Vitis riparia]
MISAAKQRLVMEKMSCKVCVTGGSGYIGSYLVKKLLQKGYTVHTTLRNMEDHAKVGLLQSFPNAETRLKLFQADIYNPDEFEEAIKGCEFVFHVATPLHHSEGFQYKNTTEAAIAGAKSIAMSCIKSGSVRRLIYTATVMAASPLTDDGSSFKDSMDESCWTPPNLSLPYTNSFVEDYTDSKTLAEKEILSFGNNSNGGLEVVTLACGLVGGDTLLSYTPASVAVLIAQLTDNPYHYQLLRFLEESLGKIPIIHIDDVCEAHIFCMEKPSIHGRFLCTNSYISSAEITDYYQKNHPQFDIKPEYLNGPKRKIKWGSTKLIEEGFEYKYDTSMILDDSIKCGRKMGDLQ